MALYEQLSADNRTAMAVAAALEEAMGPDTILTVGLPRTEVPDASLLPSNPRIVASDFTSGLAGVLAIAVTDDLARVLEATAPDEEMMTSLQGAFAVAVREIALANDGDAEIASAREIPVSDFLGGFPSDHQYLSYPLLDGTDRIATLMLQIGAAGSAAHAERSFDADTGVSTPAAPVRSTANGGLPDLEHHEFGQLPDANTINLADPRPLSLLHDVEMGVTAELGRRRMTVRDLLSLSPGAVIELDRAAGSPVDVLVNGTLIARGEVVVIDEEFGIRISEIVAGVGA
jgi:flagellar motor switch protein FliN